MSLVDDIKTLREIPKEEYREIWKAIPDYDREDLILTVAFVPITLWSRRWYQKRGLNKGQAAAVTGLGWSLLRIYFEAKRIRTELQKQGTESSIPQRRGSPLFDAEAIEAFKKVGLTDDELREAGLIIK